MILINIVHDLRRVQGRNAKMDILMREQDNDQWKKFLQYVYDGRKSYGVSASHDTNFDAADINDNMFRWLNSLNNRQITGNDAKMIAAQLSKEYGEIPRLILGRSIKAGVSITSINQAYPGLIYEFKSMKGKDVPITQYPVISSTKWDGNKTFVFVNADEIKIQTSAGNDFMIKSLYNEFKQAPEGVYEGELIHGLGRQVDRPIISGKVNSLLAGTINDIDSYSFMIYDYVPFYEWIEMVSNTDFSTRIEYRDSIFEMHFQDSMYVKPVEYTVHSIEEEMMKYNEDLILKGYEGSMHRYPEDVYVWDRVDRLIKKKSIRECTLKCVGVTPHSNPAKGNIGSLLCEGFINDKILGRVFVTAKAGALNKMDINRYPEHFIDHQVEVLYNSVTSTDDGHSLFLPRFKRKVGDI